MEPNSIPAEVLEYCELHECSDPHVVNGSWWAFHGADVIPTPVPHGYNFKVLSREELEPLFDGIRMLDEMIAVGYPKPELAPQFQKENLER
jgi:hypothetical protein